MLTLHKLVSKGIQEVISVLEGGRKQSMDAYTIGSTVQPVVEVNKGVLKYFTASGIAGNVNTVVFTVPMGKIYVPVAGNVFLDTDGTVANRYIQTLHGYSESLTNFINSWLQLGTAMAANGSGALSWDEYLNGVDGASNNDSVSYSRSSPQIFRSGDQLTITISAGVAGDAYNYYIRVLEFEVV